MSVETVARRYANALADVVLNNGDASHAETVKNELKTWEDMIVGNQNLQHAFLNPAIAHVNKVNVLESLIRTSSPAPTTANFLRVLLRNNRLSELDEINHRFESVLEERRGYVSAQVTSARELTEVEKAELTANLEKLTGKRVKLNFNIDREIIGGVVTRIGSTVYDSSVRTQLQNLKEELVNG
jgi:F-type H+-transporting ATPase subunit delta